jgi:hypothetical protein
LFTTFSARPSLDYSWNFGKKRQNTGLADVCSMFALGSETTVCSKMRRSAGGAATTVAQAASLGIKIKQFIPKPRRGGTFLRLEQQDVFFLDRWKAGYA